MGVDVAGTYAKLAILHFCQKGGRGLDTKPGPVRSMAIIPDLFCLWDRAY